MMLFPAVHVKAAIGTLLVNGSNQDKAAVNSMKMVKKSLDMSVWDSSKKNTYSYNYKKGINADKLNKEIEKAYSGSGGNRCFFYFIGNASTNGISLNGNSAYTFNNLAKKLYNVDCFQMVIVLDTPYASRFIDAASRIDKKGKFVIFAGSQNKIKPMSNYYRFSKAFAHGLGYDDYLMYGDMNHDRNITASEMKKYCELQLGNDLLSGADIDQKCKLYAANVNSVIAEYGISVGNSSKDYLDTIKLNVKKSQQLYPYVMGKKGNEKKAKWSSSNQNVASVSKSGKVTAKKVGTVTVTVDYGGVKAKCTVKVNDKNITQSQNTSFAVIKDHLVTNTHYPSKITNTQSGEIVGYAYTDYKTVDSNHSIIIEYSDYLDDADKYLFDYIIYTKGSHKLESHIYLIMYEMSTSVSIYYARFYMNDGSKPETVCYQWKNGSHNKYSGSKKISFTEIYKKLEHYSLSAMNKEANKKTQEAFKAWDEYLRNNAGLSLANFGFTSLKFNNGTLVPGEDDLEKQMSEAKNDYSNTERSFNTDGDKVVKNIMKVHDDIQKETTDALAAKIETLMASNLPANAEKAMVKTFTDKIQDTLLVKPSSYNNCKTAPQLVNKVAEQISNKKGRFSFTAGKIQYTANFKSIGVAGATFVTGTINSNNGHSYSFLGTSVSDSTINEEINNLKKFADSKIEEAKKAVYSDMKGILVPNELKKFLSTTTKSNVFKLLNKKSPDLAKYTKAATEMTEKFIAVKKAYDGLKSINLENADEAKVVKTISEYNKKVDAYDKAVDALLNIRL